MESPVPDPVPATAAEINATESPVPEPVPAPGVKLQAVKKTAAPPPEVVKEKIETFCASKPPMRELQALPEVKTIEVAEVVCAPPNQEAEAEEDWHQECDTGRRLATRKQGDWAESICLEGTRDHVKRTLKELGLSTNKDLKEFWSILDYNGNNVVSLAELDKLVVEFVAGGRWPEWFNNKPALLIAFNDRADESRGGGQIVGKRCNAAAELLRKRELKHLLGALVWYSKVWVAFDLIDEGDDRRIDEDEFVKALSKLGATYPKEQLKADFAEIDRNGGGKILFGEFCVYLKSKRKHKINATKNKPVEDAPVQVGGTAGARE
jgi:hypothetical protein